MSTFLILGDDGYSYQIDKSEYKDFNIEEYSFYYTESLKLPDPKPEIVLSDNGDGVILHIPESDININLDYALVANLIMTLDLYRKNTNLMPDYDVYVKSEL